MTCEKGSFPGKASAQKSANHAAQTYNKKMRVYRCPDCRKWHVTSSPIRQRVPHIEGAGVAPRNGPRKRGRTPLHGKTVLELAARMRGEG